LFTFSRVYDQADFPILDHVDDVRASLAHLVHPAARDAAAGEGLGRSTRRNDLEPALDQRLTELDGGRLVAVANAQERDARARQRYPRRDLGLRVRLAEGAP